MEVRIASRIIPGRRHAAARDAIAIDHDTHAAVVANGATSELVVARVVSRLAAGVDEDGNLAAAIEDAHAAVHALGAPCRLIAAAVDAGDVLRVAHVGDTRAYVLRMPDASTLTPSAPRWSPTIALASGAQLVCVTRDHSTVCDMVERGIVERAPARAHPLRARVTRAVGARGRHDPQLVSVRLAPGDRVLLCTAAVWSSIDDTRLADLLDAATDADAACNAIATALEHETDDGAAVVVIERAGAPARAPRPNTASLDEPFLRDLSAEAIAGRLDPVIGRDAEINRLAEALLHRRKPNAVLVGDAGVGKTCIVEGLAQRIADGMIPALAGTRIVEVEIGGLIAGTRYRGDLEQRARALLDRAAADPRIVLFIDELHTVVGGGVSDGDSLDLADLLKPALARGAVRIIGATTTAEYERHVAGDAALARRFEVLRVAEPDAAACLAILRGLRARLETHYRLAIGDDALIAAIDLSVRFLPDRRLPDKALDLVEAAAARRLVGGATPGDTLTTGPLALVDLARVVADRCRAPLDQILLDDRERVATLGAYLAERIVGQDRALRAVTSLVERAMIGVRDARRPVASLLFAGPTGVGKTETARALAEHLFAAGSLVRIDMSELADPHQLARLVGAPPGYQGSSDEGQLTGALRRRPSCVVLFDELDKAHPDALALLLQILDDGTLTDARGRPASFREAIVIMTTNLELRGERRIGPRASAAEPAEDDLRTELARHLRPELVGRIGRVVAFAALGPAELRRIAELHAARLTSRLREQGREIEHPVDVDRVVERLGDARFGGRHIERLVESEVGRLAARAPSAVPGDAAAVALEALRSRTRTDAALLVIGAIDRPEALAEIVENVRVHPASVDLRFLRGASDGVLALYGSAAAALAVARHDLAQEPRAQRRCVVHWGRLKLGVDDEPLGVEVQRARRIASAAELPHDARIVVTDAARDHLPADLMRDLVRLREAVDATELWADPPPGDAR
jgi:ATP-dependent Clp protease ATP-binding subunit ClpC